MAPRGVARAINRHGATPSSTIVALTPCTPRPPEHRPIQAGIWVLLDHHGRSRLCGRDAAVAAERRRQRKTPCTRMRTCSGAAAAICTIQNLDLVRCPIDFPICTSFIPRTSGACVFVQPISSKSAMTPLSCLLGTGSCWHCDAGGGRCSG